MKILVDTNVILDVLCNRPEFVEASSKVWKYCEVDQIEGYISALSVPKFDPSTDSLKVRCFLL